jgi:hypothetical protein
MRVPLKLISGIAPDHMLDSFVTARVIRKPGVQLQNMAIDNYDGSAISNETLDFAPGEDPRDSLPLSFHDCRRRVGD